MTTTRNSDLASIPMLGIRPTICRFTPHPNPLPGVPGRGSCFSAVPKGLLCSYPISYVNPNFESP